MLSKHKRTIALGLSVLVLIVLAGAVYAQGDESTIQVGVVIQGPDGDAQTYCVTVTGEQPVGADVIQATGLDIGMSAGSMGAQVCRIDAVGCVPPGESCFCQCEGGGTCAYWSYFHLTEQATWQYSIIGVAGYPVEDGDVEGWWWHTNNSQAADFPPVTFDEICGSANTAAAFPRTVVDGMDRHVTITAPPQRIASVALGSDEILLDLVGPERLLGVTFMAEDPAISNIYEQLDGIVHTDLGTNVEQLISLEADLVLLAAYNDPAIIDQLLDADVPVFVLTQFNTLDDVRANIRLLGEVTGEDSLAENLIDTMDSRLHEIQALVADQPPVRVLYYELGGITYGPGSTVDEIIRLAGGTNVVAEFDLGAYPLVDGEFVLTADPDVILVSVGFGTAGDPVEQMLVDPVFSTLRAVQAGRVYAIPNAHMTNVSHYVVLGVEDVARALYPDVFAED